MLINVTIEPRDSDCRAPQVIVEASNEQEAAEKIIAVAKTMRPEYEYSIYDDITLGGKEYTFIYAKTPNSYSGLARMIGRITKLKETPVGLIKETLLETEIFD